jgi:3-hydroxyisobutyrate dehydrogenase
VHGSAFMTDQLPKLGFIGFGVMAQCMAVHLRDAGYTVVAFDAAYCSGQLDGFHMLESSHTLARQVAVVLICVPDDKALRALIIAEGGALDGATPHQLLINLSTVSPEASRELAEAARQRKLRYMEAPMSGSTPEAETGSLVFLAGGAEDDVRAAEPILQVLGRKTVRIGAVGDGLVAKLIVTGIMALGTAALAEGLAYSVRAGIERDVIIDTLSDLVLVSEHHKRKLAMAKVGKYPPQVSTRLMSKDMGLLLADAEACGAPMPSMAAASQLYAYASQTHPDEDYAAVIESMNGLP